MIVLLALALAADPATLVDPRIGSSNGGNTFPGAVLPFGMVAWSPETTRGDATRVPAPGGYAWDAQRVRGFSLTQAEMDNEPSTAAAWLYLYAGQPWKTQATVREALNVLWSDQPWGIPGNDDLGAMSAWYVWSAMGMYPMIPGRAELLLAGPLFPRIVVRRAGGKDIDIRAPAAAADRPFVRGLQVDGRAVRRLWLPESWVERGARLRFDLAAKPESRLGTAAGNRPPSFLPR